MDLGSDRSSKQLVRWRSRKLWRLLRVHSLSIEMGNVRRWEQSDSLRTYNCCSLPTVLGSTSMEELEWFCICRLRCSLVNSGCVGSGRETWSIKAPQFLPQHHQEQPSQIIVDLFSTETSSSLILKCCYHCLFSVSLVNLWFIYLRHCLSIINDLSSVVHSFKYNLFFFSTISSNRICYC